MAVLAGTVATGGITLVALAPSAPVLAVGVLVAGSSTGIASPPLAAVVARWVQDDARDSAQTVVNAGTGVGVLVSGPIALVLLDRWRLAWALFAIVAAVVTVWISRVVPAGAPDASDTAASVPRIRTGDRAALLAAAFILGLASIAVWTFGQDAVGSAPSWLAPVAWTVIGAAGIAGAFLGPVVGWVGIRISWSVLMVLLAVGTAGFVAAAGSAAPVLAAGAVFGAAYIASTGVLLVWATRTYSSSPAVGVGLAFFMIAVGQAVGAPLVGLVASRFSLPAVFVGAL